jgi:type II secretory pathway component GspD/PulD (secretin)
MSAISGARDGDPAAGKTSGSNSGSSETGGNGLSIAQSSPRPAQPRRNPIPGIVGTVTIRKTFKLFANEQLIHNMSFRDTPVREVIAELARRGNLNIIIDKSVAGKITGDLRDVTMNEAMDSVLAAAGLQSRTLDNSTVIVATLQAMVQLGLNRPMARAFKLSYAHPYDVAMILHASIFNRGMLPDFNSQMRRRSSNESSDSTDSGRARKAGGMQPEGEVSTESKNTNGESDKSSTDIDSSQTNRPDVNRTIRGSSRSQTQEGVGFNNAATDPGSQQIRSFQEINSDYTVEQNGGGAIVIPDSKNRQILVVGTQEDINIAEESIKLLDRRPKQVHIQASLIELTNQGIRQLGATLNVQGDGASSSILGNSRAPLIQYLPGLGSTFPSPAAPFGTTLPSTNATPVTAGNPGTAFSGLVGSLLPVAPTIAGIQASQFAQSAFNFLTGGTGTGGKQNIATVPTALNLDLQLLLQTNKAKVVANPSVVVVDDTETLITIASEVVHKVTSTVSLGVVTTNVELTKAGIFLNVLPKVTEDGFITMRLRPQVSTPLGPPQVFGSSTSPTIVTLLNVREIMSQEVRIKDGQTLVLGGLFSEQEAAQLAKVPYLAEAPILGALFRNSLKGRNRSELMLLLTPKIVEDEPTSLTDSQTSPTM